MKNKIISILTASILAVPIIGSQVATLTTTITNHLNNKDILAKKNKFFVDKEFILTK